MQIVHSSLFINIICHTIYIYCLRLIKEYVYIQHLCSVARRPDLFEGGGDGAKQVCKIPVICRLLELLRNGVISYKVGWLGVKITFVKHSFIVSITYIILMFPILKGLKFYIEVKTTFYDATSLVMHCRILGPLQSPPLLYTLNQSCCPCVNNF